MTDDISFEELPNIFFKVRMASDKVTAAKVFLNGNKWHAPQNSYIFNVIANIIRKLDIQTPVVMFYFLLKYQVSMTSFLASNFIFLMISYIVGIQRLVNNSLRQLLPVCTA